MAKSNQTLSSQKIIIPFLLLILSCLVFGSGYVYLTTTTLDQQELEQTAHLAESAITYQLEELGNWARDYAFWDDINEKVVKQLDREWANNNIGQYLHDSYDISQSHVIDSKNSTIIAYQDGVELNDSELLDTLPSSIKKLLQQTRATLPQDPQAATGILRYQGDVLLVAASVITPEHPGSKALNQLSRPVLVLTRVISPQMLAEIGGRYLLKDLQLNQASSLPGMGLLVLHDHSGGVVGGLQWRLSTPGMRMLKKLLPMFAFVLLLVGGLTLQILRKILDYSKEKEASERALIISEERLSTALHTTNMGLWDWDIKYDISYYNPTYYSMAGYTPDEFKSTFRNFLQCVHEDDREGVNLALHRHLTGASKGYETEFRFAHKEGGWIWIRSKGEIISRDEMGTPTRMIGIHADVTESKKALEAKQALEMQLHQKNKMESIGTMAGGIAHDFNNILAIILSNIHLAVNKCGPESAAVKNLTQAQNAANRAADLIMKILAFSRQDEHSFRNVNLPDTVAESLKLLRATVPATVEIHLRSESDPVPLNIKADPVQLQRVFFNLCTNAIYAVNGKGVLEIVLAQEFLEPEDMPVTTKCSAGEYAKLSISDNGRGMDDEEMSKIFDPFFTTKKVGAGTGMGLSLVHGIIESHDGFITVDSHLGKGSTFTIYLPINNEKVLEKLEAIESLRGGIEKILLVDDEAELACACKEVLELQGYRVTSLTSSLDALELFKGRPEFFDLVITDQTMPGLTGTELAAKLLDIRADLPIVLCSGYSAKLSEADARALGIREFCRKPYDIQQLSMVLRKILDDNSN